MASSRAADPRPPHRPSPDRPRGTQDSGPRRIIIRESLCTGTSGISPSACSWSRPRRTATAQSPPAGTPPAPARRPFAKPDAPRQTERIREVDIKHIKAELTLDTEKKEVRGTVTHTLTPLHPYLTRVELDCGPKLKVSKVTAGPQRGRRASSSTKGEKLSITLDKPYGPDDTIDLAISYAGSPESGLHFVTPDPAYPEKPPAIWTQGEAEDNHHWLPCYDYPNDRVTTEMIITVAKPLFVVSNGVLVETKENCRRHADLPLEDGPAPLDLPDLAGRRRLRRRSTTRWAICPSITT